MASHPSRAKRSISARADQGLSWPLSRSARCAFVSLTLSLMRLSPFSRRKDESRERPPLRPSSRLLSSASTCALGGVLSRIRERHRHPRLTATTLGRDATGCPVDAQNGVLDHDLVCLLDHHVRPAHRATLLSDTVDLAISQSLERHVANSPYPNRFCQELFDYPTASSI